MSDGKLIVLDAESDSPTTRFKGMLNSSFIGQFHQGSSRPLIYVVDTFHSRGNRGERTDVLTVYDKSHLSPVYEVVVPAKRASGMPTNFHLQTVDDEKLALIYNFTPAQSVSVVDLEKREFVGEVSVPGCALVYPMAGRAFASLCGDGSMYSVQLDAEGKQASTSRTEKFFDPDNDPVMEKAAYHDGIVYFPSFDGEIVPVDMRGETPKVLTPWSLVDDIEGGWRPGGVSVISADSKGNLFVMMHPDGHEGTHKDPGVEIWVADIAKQKVSRRIAMTTPVMTIALTRDDKLLLATTVEMNVDVYDAGSGELQRTLTDFGQETPLMLHGAN